MPGDDGQSDVGMPKAASSSTVAGRPLAQSTTSGPATHAEPFHRSTTAAMSPPGLTGRIRTAFPADIVIAERSSRNMECCEPSLHTIARWLAGGISLATPRAAAGIIGACTRFVVAIARLSRVEFPRRKRRKLLRRRRSAVRPVDSPIPLVRA